MPKLGTHARAKDRLVKVQQSRRVLCDTDTTNGGGVCRDEKEQRRGGGRRRKSAAASSNRWLWCRSLPSDDAVSAAHSYRLSSFSLELPCRRKKPRLRKVRGLTRGREVGPVLALFGRSDLWTSSEMTIWTMKRASLKERAEGAKMMEKIDGQERRRDGGARTFATHFAPSYWIDQRDVRCILATTASCSSPCSLLPPPFDTADCLVISNDSFVP